MSTKIQINSLAALERLIGGDSETELEIRQSVVTEFVKKHLKGIADQQIVYSAAINLRNSIDEEIRKQIAATIGEYQVSGYGARKFFINNNVKEEIQKHLTSALIETIKESIEEFVPNISALVNAELNRRLDVKIKEIVNNKVTEQLNKIKDSL